MKGVGLPISDIVQHMHKEVEGLALSGFRKRDAYNVVGKEKKKQIERGNACTLIEKFTKRASNEKDFLFAFELSELGDLISFFWRDDRMKGDYMLFGDLVVHDTIHRTKKYDMICGPFVGMNHHGRNTMFGCGFMLNERTKSFAWLFKKFLESMDFKHPIIVMTDQLKDVFLEARHRLRFWHIGESANKTLRVLMQKEGFHRSFKYKLKFCECVDEFEYRWKSLMEKYNCGQHPWLLDLYKKKVKWCPAYNKVCFDGGVLSSQRSEFTNNALCKRITASCGLYDFYNIFQDVISKWMSNQKNDNVDYQRGCPDSSFSNVGLLFHATRVYTIHLFGFFEEEYRKAVTQCQKFLGEIGVYSKYKFWNPSTPDISYVVAFNKNTHYVKCWCDGFDECGYLCSHCLRVYIVNVWKMNIRWKFDRLIATCESNEKARKVCEDYLTSIVNLAEEEVGKIYPSESKEKVTDKVDCCSIFCGCSDFLFLSSNLLFNCDE